MGSVAVEGFDRSQILALFDLHAIPIDDRPELLSAVLDLESEFRSIRSVERKKQEDKDRLKQSRRPQSTPARRPARRR